MYLKVLLMNGIDDIFVRLSTSQSNIAYCSEMGTEPSWYNYTARLVIFCEGLDLLQLKRRDIHI